MARRIKKMNQGVRTFKFIAIVFLAVLIVGIAMSIFELYVVEIPNLASMFIGIAMGFHIGDLVEYIIFKYEKYRFTRSMNQKKILTNIDVENITDELKYSIFKLRNTKGVMVVKNLKINYEIEQQPVNNYGK